MVTDRYRYRGTRGGRPASRTVINEIGLGSDWRIGAPIEEVRRVRSDIESRVRGLLAELGVGAGSHADRLPDAAAP